MIMHHRHHHRQAGYSIVEIAIVLVAISFLVTSAMWTFADHNRLEKRKETQDYMDAMHVAILNYATQNRTVGTHVVYFDSNSSLSPEPQSHPTLIPSGRPILPCPDLDGDGLEDRYKSVDAATVTIGFEYDDGLAIIDLDDVNGRCLDFKGNIPWRTLRTKPYDPWGQIYTYYVDPNFSHALFGFDQTTRASPVFKYLAQPTLDHRYTYPVHYRNITGSSTTPEGRLTEGRTVMPRSPVVMSERTSNSIVNFGAITTSIKIGVVAGDLFLPNYQNYRNATEVRRMRTLDGPERVIYEYLGVQVKSTTAIDLDDPFVMANGLAFVIVSHGKNGYGGLTYLTNYGNPAASYECRDIPNSGHESEIRNALKTLPCTERDALYSGACSPTGAAGFATCGAQDSSHATFVTNHLNYQNSGTGQYGFDDIVSWMHPTRLDELLRARQIFPLTVPPLAVLNIWDAPPYNHFNDFVK